MALVDMVIANELLPELPEALVLLRARERSRRPAVDYPDGTVVGLEIEGVPEGAKRICPVFQRTPDGVRVTSMGWQYTP